ncbi:uncharacterized protein [Gossypium hirsutum]|uniref:Uncharacterized protein n=1 Tax=Gossypium hirsutum TaxID=3635 RepID=A0A1U8IE98_GOSHI|nr:uncharacterized protein LOC107895809 [Gossypium hirsutum]
MDRHREDIDDVDVIASTFFIHSILYYALIDIGSTHSYIVSVISTNLGITTKNTAREFSVISPLGQLVQVGRVYREVPLEIQGMVFPSNLMELPFNEFNLILGMDWLVEYQVSLDCATKRVTLRTDENDKLSVGDIRTMRESLDVFPEELPKVPLDREVEFGINLLPSTAPVSIAPYYMAPKEITKLKA